METKSRNDISSQKTAEREISFEKKKPWGKFFGWAAVGFWLVMMGMLVQRQNCAQSPPPFADVPLPAMLEEDGTVGAEEEWMGIYFRGSKIGWIHVASELQENGYIVREESRMHLKVMDTSQRIWTKTTCWTDNTFALNSFDFQMKSDVISLVVSGEIRGKTLYLDIQSAGKVQKKEISCPRRPYLFINLRPYLFYQGFEVGKSLRFPVVLPSTLNQSEVVITIEEEEDITVHDEVWRAFRIKQSFAGIEVTSWYDKEGRPLKEVSPMGFTMLREDARTALQGVEEGGDMVDIIASTMVSTDRELPEPSSLQYIHLSLKGIDPLVFDLEGGRQHLQGSTLEIFKEDLEPSLSITVPVEDKAFETSLKATPFVQSDDERIQKLSREIVGEERDGVKVAGLLMDWVYQNLEKRPTVSLPSALEVLDLEAGDCNEHAVLMAALARAVGLPAKLVVGIVYLENGFYYHAWTEVWVGKWMSLDPVMSQFPADITHVKFIEGGLEQQIRMTQVIGKLSIDILEYR